jgi:hypothetical protein
MYLTVRCVARSGGMQEYLRREEKRREERRREEIENYSENGD